MVLPFQIKMFTISTQLSSILSGRFGFREICSIRIKQLRRHIQISPIRRETFLSGVVLKGKQIKVSQHYFEEPVLQPRSATNQRREADLTGLKGTYTINDSKTNEDEILEF